jgi:hypothetical protein
VKAHEVARYVTPLREGGSLPAIVETASGELFVAKFRGAGQGAKALVAEIVAGEIGRALGLRVPELALLDLDAGIGRAERHDEIRDLLLASVGVNVGLAYLPGALMYDPAAKVAIDGATASQIVAFDALVMNVDRTARNPNLLWCASELWLIDHGASLYFQHDWDGSIAGADRPFTLVAQHVLLHAADALDDAAAALRATIDEPALRSVVAQVPDALLPEDPDRWREAYVQYLLARIAATNIFIAEAKHARGV